MMENFLAAAGKKDSPLHMTDVNYAGVKYIFGQKLLESRRAHP
jgi:hypothetical protein